MNADTARSGRDAHRLSMQGRTHMEVSGVTDVVSFDEEMIVLSTECGTMTVEGGSLHIHVLSIDQGIVSLDGRVDSIAYFESNASEKDAKSGFFGRLFR